MSNIDSIRATIERVHQIDRAICEGNLKNQHGALAQAQATLAVAVAILEGSRVLAKAVNDLTAQLPAA